MDVTHPPAQKKIQAASNEIPVRSSVSEVQFTRYAKATYVAEKVRRKEAPGSRIEMNERG